MSNSRIMYIRDFANWNPVGCVVINVDRNRQRAEYQLAVLNPNDRDPKTNRKIRFDRKEAQRLAMARLLNKPVTVRLPEEASQHDISRTVMEDIAGNKQFPARAVKFAKNWLKFSELLFEWRTNGNVN